MGYYFLSYYYGSTMVDSFKYTCVCNISNPKCVMPYYLPKQLNKNQ